jgi:5-methylcytosine-specific restriction endonuclease McrA
MIQSEHEKRTLTRYGSVAHYREHRYRGGPPPVRIKRMQLGHEVRARKYGVDWDIIDLRVVYTNAAGICGICGLPVGIDEFVIDHIVPMSKGGPHLQSNLQPAHCACNNKKGNR